MEINGRIIGDGHPAYIIAEMSANHAGSLERALELIHVAKDAGADCVKIQTYTADTMTIDCHNEYFQIEKGTWEGENLYGLYQKPTRRGSGRNSFATRRQRWELTFCQRRLTRALSIFSKT